MTIIGNCKNATIFNCTSILCVSVFECLPSSMVASIARGSATSACDKGTAISPDCSDQWESTTLFRRWCIVIARQPLTLPVSIGELICSQFGDAPAIDEGSSAASPMANHREAPLFPTWSFMRATDNCTDANRRWWNCSNRLSVCQCILVPSYLDASFTIPSCY